MKRASSRTASGLRGFKSVVWAFASLAALATTSLAQDPFSTLIAKSVDKTFYDTGYTEIYTVNANYGDGELLSDVAVRDFVPPGTTFDSAGQGGSLATFVSKPGIDGHAAFGGDDVVRVYAFQGGSTATFWAYTPGSNTWNTLTNAPGSITTGGALTTDEARYLYAFQGGSRAFYRYDAVNEVWSDSAVADLPAGASTAGDGSALVYYEGDVYAFIGGTTQFWRYHVAGNTWLQMASTPAAVGAGGSLATDGAFILGLRGGGTTAFWRYDAAGNAWLALAGTVRNVGAGAGLAFGDDGHVYATEGAGLHRFYRYDSNLNAWTQAAQSDFAPGAGGALATDGATIFALQGNNTTGFVDRQFSSASVALEAAPSAVNAGGALVYLASPAKIATTRIEGGAG